MSKVVSITVILILITNSPVNAISIDSDYKEYMEEKVKEESIPEPEPIPEPIQEPCNTFECHLDMSNISTNDYSFVYYIIGMESNYDYTAINPDTGAIGYCQLNPYWHDVPIDFNNPISQLNWCNDYAIERYGGWYNAYYSWVSQGWW